MPEPGKPAPSSLISLNVILCEKILLEKDEIFSAIRIVDVFYFRRDPTVPIESQAIPVCILVMGKIQPEDKSEHWAQIVLHRPGLNPTPIGEPLRAVFQAEVSKEGKSLLAEGSKVSDIVGGFTIRAEFSIVPSQVGRYQLEVLMDNALVARVPFTILELKPRTGD
jgi:hypothetical protein